MVKELEERIQERINKIRIEIDDYKDTVFAIIGFVNLYYLDEKSYKPRPNVKRFQGRKLTSVIVDEAEGREKEIDISPDFGIVINNEKAIVGEVKKNFPKEDKERAKKIFEQLKNYDSNIKGWPGQTKEIESHELTLLVHLTTSPYAVEYYRNSLPEEGIEFERQLSIIEFTRIEQMQHFFHYKVVLGEVTEIGEDKKLVYGIQVPMSALLKEYARTKIYDGVPPLPYLVNLIWFHVITPLAAEDTKFESLRKNQNLEIAVGVDKIAEQLNEGFSFNHWHKYDRDRQTSVPRIEWVKEACNFLVQTEEAEWAKGSANDKLIVFYRKYEDTEQHFIESYVAIQEKKKETPILPGLEHYFEE